MSFRPRRTNGFLLLLSAFAALSIASVVWSQLPEDRRRQLEERSRRAEAEGLADAFVGVTTSDGKIEGLFELRSTGVSTEPVREAADAFLASLTPEQRARTVFPVDDPEWRKWMNQHFYMRQGVGFIDMDDSHREAAFGLLDAALSAKGLKLTRDIMRLNHTLGELKNDFDEYGEWLYYITVMGEPSPTEPWGFQLDGHHAIINYFVLGDQVVMTPLFVGSEPVIAEAGKYQGTAILQEEQAAGLEMIRALSESQQARAILTPEKTGNNNLTEAFKDNVVLDYAGAAVGSFDDAQKKKLLELAAMFIDNMEAGHARIRMEEIEEHLNETWFAWVGGTGDDDVFYYRIQSPVVLIEFDHQSPAGLRHLYPREPMRQHVHVVVRTPNGNDYGKDLLRQHYERHAHSN